MSQDESFAPIVIETGKRPTASVIWLHGLGADGHDFAPIVPQLQLPNKPAVRFVFPHAPRRAVTINQGFVMRAWYDIAPDSDGLIADREGIEESAAALHQLIEQENQRGITTDWIILAGFSQGGAIALYTAWHMTTALAGVMALSTYLPLPAGSDQAKPAMPVTVPVFMGHGRHDSVIPCVLGRQSCERLQQAGVTVEWHEYVMDHSVCDEEINDIGSWLRRILCR